MSNYIKSKKEMEFPTIESLKSVQSVIDDADKALNDKSRKISDSPISSAVSAAAGAGIGGAIGFAGLYFGGSVVGLSAAGITSGLAAAGGIIGGGMAAGIAVIAAPAVALGAVGVGVAAHHRNAKLKESKELAYKNAIAKQNAIIKALRKESNADKERIEYLTGLNVLLNKAIEALRHDLGYAA